MNEIKKMLLRFADECVKAANDAEHMYDVPKAPTHEEIMTKWWKSDCGYLWHKVFWYKPNTKQYYVDGIVCSIKWFTGRKSATIPPEAL